MSPTLLEDRAAVSSTRLCGTLLGTASGTIVLSMRAQLSVICFTTPAVMYVVLADHPPSASIRECIRCIQFIFCSRRSLPRLDLGSTCQRADVNLDGIRDSRRDALVHAFLRGGRHIGYSSVAWCIQTIINRLLALEEAFVEPLPFTWLTNRLSHFVHVLYLPLLITLNLVPGYLDNLSVVAVRCVTALILLAFAFPQKQLQECRQDDVPDATQDMEGELAFAIEALRCSPSRHLARQFFHRSARFFPSAP